MDKSLKGLIIILSGLFSLFALVACSTFAGKGSESMDELKDSYKENYMAMALLNYQDSLVGAKRLDKEIDIFLKAAAKGQRIHELKRKMNGVKKTWSHDARMPYGESEIFRFNNGPIDFEPAGVNTSYLATINHQGVEGLLNAWPLDEAYIDYVNGNKRAGVINDPSVKITKKLLVAMNERDGEKNISTGFHAIEFLLWGQDRSLKSAGLRPVTDFVDGGSARNQNRRRKYLKTLSSLLVEHLSSVESHWRSDEDNFRAQFTKLSSDQVLAQSLNSVISMLGDELKSERIENAFMLGDQEEEHSCFSDKTINDIYTNAKGAFNLYRGGYKAYNMNAEVKGTGLSDLVKKSSESLHNEILENFNQLFKEINFFYSKDSYGKAKIGDIATPFDYALTHNKKEIKKIIDRLSMLDEQFKEVANLFGIKIQ
jgi:putative iron-regulated protein